MNVRIIDGWSLIHLIFGFLVGYFLLSFRISIFIIFSFIVFFELLEHSIIGDLIFGWVEKKSKEKILNSIMDIVIGTLGALISYYYLLNY